MGAVIANPLAFPQSERELITKFGVGPWLVWLSWWEHCPVIERLWVQSPVWAHPGGNQLMFLSLPSSLSKNNKKNCPWGRMKKDLEQDSHLTM